MESAPGIADLDGDGTLDAFFIGGKGTSDETRATNQCRAFCVPLGRGKGPD